MIPHEFRENPNLSSRYCFTCGRLRRYHPEPEVEGEGDDE